jgi:hypothetical protein
LHTLSRIDSQRGILHIGDTAGLPAEWKLEFITRRLHFKTGPLIQELKKRTGAVCDPDK